MAVKTKKETNEARIEVPGINIQTCTIHLVGDSPLIMHKWSEKAKKEILDKQMKKATKGGYETKNPVADFIESMYWLEGKPEENTEEAFVEAVENGARFGFPSVAFKAAAISAGYRAEVLKNKVTAKAAFHIDDEFVEIIGRPTPRTDMVRVGGISKTADIRFRGEFKTWEAYVTVRYNASVISAEQLVNLFNLGGFACGVGEWRVEKDGSFGMFHVE